MKATVEQSTWKAGRSSDDELERQLAQSRAVLNARYSGGPFTLETAASGAFETIWTSDDMPSDCAWEVDALVMGFGGVESARYQIAALFTRTGSAAPVQTGSTDYTVSIESSAGLDVQFAVAGNGIVLQVKDGGLATMQWSAQIMGRRVP